MLRQGFVNCRPGHTERIGGLYLAACRAGAFCKEIADELCRCVPVGTAQAIGGRLAGTLELDAGERVIVGKVLRRDVNEQGGICVASVAGIETGPVDAQMARFGRWATSL